MDLNSFDPVATDYDCFVHDFHGNSDGFVEFHLSLADKYGQDGILDIACGTGALTIPLLQSGYDVTALDLSAEMVEATRKKTEKNNLRADLFVANMADFDIDRKFSLAIIARSGFMYLLTAQEQRLALLNIRRHLTDGGVLTLNTFQPHPIMQAESMKASPGEYYPRAEYVNREGKNTRILYAAVYDHIAQIMRGSWIFETLDSAGNVVDARTYPQVTRHTYRQEMEHLFELCGYDILNVHNNYRCDAAKDIFIWVVRKK
ncbi:MAG: class I SAM-dependent methyltransferase [Phycisphaerales bacterium]|nr:class I SAM-dependent methyltransferase [Phycisphaerales bacterium]